MKKTMLKVLICSAITSLVLSISVPVFAMRISYYPVPKLPLKPIDPLNQVMTVDPSTLIISDGLILTLTPSEEYTIETPRGILECDFQEGQYK